MLSDLFRNSVVAKSRNEDKQDPQKPTAEGDGTGKTPDDCPPRPPREDDPGREIRNDPRREEKRTRQ